MRRGRPGDERRHAILDTGTVEESVEVLGRILDEDLGSRYDPLCGRWLLALRYVVRPKGVEPLTFRSVV